MRRGMLRPEVHGVIAYLSHAGTSGQVFSESALHRMQSKQNRGGEAKIASFAIPIMLFADDTRRDLAWLDSDRLVDNPLLVRVIAHLDIAAQWEILAERVADKSVVRENTAQIRVTGKHDAIKIECFAFEPVCGRPNAYHRVENGKVVIFREYPHSQPAVMAY